MGQEIVHFPRGSAFSIFTYLNLSTITERACLTSMLCNISVREQRVPTSQTPKRNKRLYLVIISANTLAYKRWRRVTSLTEEKAVSKSVVLAKKFKTWTNVLSNPIFDCPKSVLWVESNRIFGITAQISVTVEEEWPHQ